MAEEDPREPPDPGSVPPSDDEEDRAAILARRRALIRRTVASLGAVVVSGLVTDCASAVSPEDGAVDAAPQACLRVALDSGPIDSSPQPCLSPPAIVDVAPSTDASDASEDLGTPLPCLDTAMIPDAGDDG